MVSGFTILEFTVLGLKWLRVEVLSFYIPEPSADLSAHRMGPHNIGAVMARVDVKLGRRRFVPFERGLQAASNPPTVLQGIFSQTPSRNSVGCAEIGGLWTS